MIGPTGQILLRRTTRELVALCYDVLAWDQAADAQPLELDFASDIELSDDSIPAMLLTLDSYAMPKGREGSGLMVVQSNRSKG